jgi:hypothetical protein
MIVVGLLILLSLLYLVPKEKPTSTGKIVMYSTTNLLDSYGRYTVPWNQMYASKHGHEFVLDKQPSILSSPAWEKIRVMREALDANTEWVLYLDVDAIFNNPNMSVYDAIASRGDYDVIVCSDRPNSDNKYVANGGVLFVRNTEGGHYFLDKLWSLRYEYTQFAYEQEAMSDLLLADDPRFVALVCDPRAFNSDYSTVKVIETTKQWPDDYIVHLMATPDDVRSELFRTRIQELDNQ